MTTRTPTQLRRAADRLYEAASRWRSEASQHVTPIWLLSDADAATHEALALEATAIWLEGVQSCPN